MYIILPQIKALYSTFYGTKKMTNHIYYVLFGGGKQRIVTFQAARYDGVYAKENHFDVFLEQLEFIYHKPEQKINDNDYLLKYRSNRS